MSHNGAKKQIIAIGGGAFRSHEKKQSYDLSIIDYFIQQTGKSAPKVCFIPTASGELSSYIIRFYQIFSSLGCKPSHLSFFDPHTADMESYLLEQDAIFVGGGNTKSMLALWREWGVDRFLRRAWEQGVVLGGESAGSICWFEQGVTDSIPGPLTMLPALGFLKGSNCPHYDGEKERRPSYERMMQSGAIQSGIAIDDYVAVHFIDQEVMCVVKANPKANAYALSVVENKIVETIL